MTTLKTLLVTLLWLTMTTQSQAATVMSEDPLRLFATCSGRLSAHWEHQWLTNDLEPRIEQSQRDQMNALIFTLLNDDTASDVLNWRINAKHAHARLLTQASFSYDPEAADWALKRAQEEVESCLGLMLN